MNTVWHDLECGSYVEDLSLWRSLADEHGDPILDVGAGTGRVALDLAQRGHRVTALDLDRELLDELSLRAGELDLLAVQGDARGFELEDRFALCLVPMQAIQLFGGGSGRAAFLEQAHRHLLPGGVLAAAITSRLEPYEVIDDGGPVPVPDMCERDGVVYASQPTAVRVAGPQFVLERRRETVALDGTRTVASDAIALDRLSERELELEAEAAGFTVLARATIPSTVDYVGSEVVIARA